MPHAVTIKQPGGPSVLRYESISLPEPGPGEARIRQSACGVNFVDTYFRSGLYPLPAYPAVLGNEAAGEVVAIGPGVEGLKLGQRVAYSHDLGSYASERIMPAERLVSVPDGVSDMMAAAVILKGTTAYYLLHDTFPVGSGTVVLVYAAAGGVGSLLCQWARHLGATVIGAVGSEEKIDLARSNGCHHVILSRPREIASQVRAFTGGTGCDVVYDGIGRDTFADSLDCLRPRGLLASFGSASGPVVGVELGLLAKKGSLFVTRPTGRDYLGTASELQRAAASVFDAVAANVLRVKIHAEYPLREAERAHRDLERRATTGSLVLRP